MPTEPNSPVADDLLGLYISIPFCASKCTYCNFASGVFPEAGHGIYMDRVLDEARGAREWAAGLGAHLPRRVDTVYLGGGTPSLLAPELIDRLFAGLRASFDLAPGAEITVECAPGRLSDGTLAAMVEAGVNRVSLGVQSFVDAETRASGRLHTAAQVAGDLKRLRAAGIRNLNLDLLAGLAGQTPASWRQSLDELVASGVPHASVYMLEIDEDSRLGRELLLGGSRYRAQSVPAEERIVEFYEAAIAALAEAGLDQYEISNFAHAGHESRHNLRYWQRRPYLGLGLDASSMLPGVGEREGQALRTSTGDDYPGYLAAQTGRQTEWLSRARQHEEAWFLGLRTNLGVDPAALAAEFGEPLVSAALAAAARPLADGLLEPDGRRLRLTPRGRLFSNEVFARFLDLEIPHLNAPGTGS